MSENKVKKDLKNGEGLGQLTVTLCGICAVCALALGLVNHVTAPIIAANEEAKKTQAIAAEVLPGFSGTLTQVNYVGSDSTVNAVQKGSDGSFVVEVSPKSSFSGTLTLLVGIDAEGKIAGISATSSGETEGIGSRALEREYIQAQYVGKTGPVELTKNGGDVEGITGATFTSGAVRDAVNSACEAIKNTNDAPFDPSLVPDNEPDPTDDVTVLSAEAVDGGYEVKVDCSMVSFSKNLTIQVNLDSGKTVTSVTIVESGETPGFGALASEPDFIDQFAGTTDTVNLTTNGGEIETIAGASTTSNAVCVGVNAARKAVEALG